MLHLDTLIGHGTKRQCYEHPHDVHKCIKIANTPQSIRVLSRELRTFRIVRPVLHDFIVQYDDTLVETDKGLALVCELVRNDDGTIAQSFAAFLNNHDVLQQIEPELNRFASLLIKHNLFFFDFNQRNFVIQFHNGKACLRFIDLKSFRTTKFWTSLKMEHFIPAVGRAVMKRRLKRLYHTLKLDFPF